METQNSPDTSSIDDPEPIIARRSTWSGFLVFVGVISILVSVLSFAYALFNDGRGSAHVLGIIACCAAIQSFFLAFLVDVLTDIRWFLHRIAEKDAVRTLVPERGNGADSVSVP